MSWWRGKAVPGPSHQEPTERGTALWGVGQRAIRQNRAALRRGVLTRAILWRRPLVVAVLTTASVAAALNALAPAPPATERVLVAARDLPGGIAVGASDLTLVPLPKTVVPRGSLRDAGSVTGRILAGPARRGEPLTDVRLVGPALLAGLGDGIVIAPVRLSDPGVVTMLRSGDLVDILAAHAPAEGGLDDPFVTGTGSGATGSASVVAAGVRVITIPSDVTDSGSMLGGAAPAPGGGDGALVLIAATPETAQRLAAAAVTSSLSVIVRAG